MTRERDATDEGVTARWSALHSTKGGFGVVAEEASGIARRLIEASSTLTGASRVVSISSGMPSDGEGSMHACSCTDTGSVPPGRIGKRSRIQSLREAAKGEPSA